MRRIWKNSIVEVLLKSLKISRHFIYFFNVIFERERERDRVQAGERQRERQTRNPKQAPGSEWPAQSPTRGSNS